MTQFTRKSFSVASPHTEQYADNFDRIFRGPAAPLSDDMGPVRRMFEDSIVSMDKVIALPIGIDEGGQIVRETTSMERWSRVVQLFTRVVSEELTPEQAADYFVQGGGERVWFESMWMLIKEI